MYHIRLLVSTGTGKARARGGDGDGDGDVKNISLPDGNILLACSTHIATYTVLHHTSYLVFLFLTFQPNLSSTDYFKFTLHGSLCIILGETSRSIQTPSFLSIQRPFLRRSANTPLSRVMSFFDDCTNTLYIHILQCGKIIKSRTYKTPLCNGLRYPVGVNRISGKRIWRPEG